MGRLWSTIQKELILLSRDFAGLMVLFVMPVVLVIVVTLVQENVLRSMGETKARVLFVDRDRETVGRSIKDALKKSSSLQIVENLDRQGTGSEGAIEAVAKGDFQFSIVIPEGTTAALKRRMDQEAKDSLVIGDLEAKPKTAKQPEALSLLIYFDPTLRETFRSAAIGFLEKVILGIEVNERLKALSGVLPVRMEAVAKRALGVTGSADMKVEIPTIRISFDNQALMQVKERTASYGSVATTPNTLQQNVPAWTLFGMFFTVVPLGASLIRERQDGVLARMLTMPISYMTIISGKIAAYVIICMTQFALIMTVGSTLLPLFGTPVLEVGSSISALILVALCSALCATGYGILLGTIARTYEQASMFGAVSVVIAAALGGIMVPTYVMPKIMQQVSHFSPLAWGLNAFLYVFVRGGGVGSVLPELAYMVSFFVFAILLAWFYGSRRGLIRIR